MYQRLSDLLAGREDNYLLPFYWQHGGHTERIPAQIGRIYESGCRALCVESRPHPDFVAEGWWQDMDIILSECEKRGMKVWILDDDHFPTGHACGVVSKYHPEKKSWQLVERHADCMGPMKGASYYIHRFDEGDVLIGAYLCRRDENRKNEAFTGEVIDLSGSIRDDYVVFDVPEGMWRIMVIFRSQHFAHDSVDMLSPDSVSLLIDTVYEPHYAHYARYFGNTLAGFFSDEPQLRNELFARSPDPKLFNHRTVGQPGLTLPWSEEIPALMRKELDSANNPVPVLPSLIGLWYPFGKETGAIRHAYMNAVSLLYQKAFTGQLGAWCERHGVEYIGHVVEDMNTHARLNSGSAHYFRALKGQHMGGMDIVLHQVMPGFAHFDSAACSSGGVNDAQFYHYMLAQLCVSDACTDPVKKGRALCEVFGAYGWAEGTPLMKWLADFLLVRGVNYFVPHAFSPDFPDPDCPPHFGGEGHDPQWEGFSFLMRYMNRVSHLLSGSERQADVAILYHAEAEWMNGFDKMYMQVPAQELLDHQICYDILCRDHLEKAEVQNGVLCLGNRRYHCLFVPEAAVWPDAIVKLLLSLSEKGFPIFCVGKVPETLERDLPSVAVSDVAQTVRQNGWGDLMTDRPFPFLRFFHGISGSNQIFFFFNESAVDIADLSVILPCVGSYTRLNLASDEMETGSLSGHALPLRLAPYGSEIYIFGETADMGEKETFSENGVTLSEPLTLSVASYEDLSSFRTIGQVRPGDVLPLPDSFSGLMQYDLTLKGNGKKVRLDLGQVGQTARLTLNGNDLGIRICPPYAFNFTLPEGESHLSITVAGTLANALHDPFSDFMVLPPSGLIGPIVLYPEM